MGEIIAVVGLVLPIALAWVTYSYRNRIGWDVVSIAGHVTNLKHFDTEVSSWEEVTAQRVRFKSFGLRSLDMVELHFALHDEPLYMEVVSTTSLSKSIVELAHRKDMLVIRVPRLPSGEEIKIDIITIGSPQSAYNRMFGTGGKYKIVDYGRAEIGLNNVQNLFWLFGGVMAMVAVLTAVTGRTRGEPSLIKTMTTKTPSLNHSPEE